MQSYLSLIKFSHTIFALPFAIIGFFLATHYMDYDFEWTKLSLVVLCMVFARSAAMAFNRLIDSDIDQQNDRTAVREIPAGVVSKKSATLFVLLNCIAFIVTTYFINTLCFMLSPVALAVILGYSYTKRFTFLCHIILGVGLSLAPIGAFLAVSSQFEWLPIYFSLVVLFWVSGFDVIYALQDEEFDKEQKLFSIPSFFGVKKALWISNILHIVCATLLIAIGLVYSFTWIYWIGATLFIGLLFYQHLIVKPNDLSRINLAFFTTNGIASILFALFVLAELIAF